MSEATILSTILVLLQIIVAFVFNNNTVYYDSYTFHYRTLRIPVLYMETVPPGVDTRWGVPQ